MLHVGDVDRICILDLDPQCYRDEDERDEMDVKGQRDEGQTDVVVECKKMLDQEELHVTEVMEVLALLEEVERCPEGIEDVVANPSDIQYDDVANGVFLDDVVEHAPVEDHDFDALDVQLVGVHCLPDAHLFVDDLLLLDADVLGDLIVLDDLVYEYVLRFNLRHRSRKWGHQ